MADRAPDKARGRKRASGVLGEGLEEGGYIKIRVKSSVIKGRGWSLC